MFQELFLQILFALVALVATVSALFYLYVKKSYRYWKEVGVVGPEPEMVYGNLKPVFTLKQTEAECVEDIYDQFPNEKFVGIYSLWKPVLLVRDLTLIRHICEYDFANFMDHPQMSHNSGTDAVIHGLFFLKGEDWRLKRQALTKVFTPRKLKEYVVNVEKQLDILTEELRKFSEEDKDVDITDLFEKAAAKFVSESFYTTDLSKDPETASQLIKASNFFSCPPPSTVLKSLLYSVVPSVNKLLRLRTLPSEIWDIYSTFTSQLLKSIENNHDDRSDFIYLLKKFMDQGLKNNQKITFEEAVAHMYVFMLGGHHTTQLTIAHTLFQLSKHPEVQEKVHQEIDDVLQGAQHLTYESVQKLTFLNCVIKEAMRIYPLLGVLKRVSTSPYKLTDNITLPAGIDIMIPASSIHNSPEYFPEPEVFRPERFLDDKIKSPAFMPFGKGPRICIGARFGETMATLSVAKILQKYRVAPSNKTKLPFKFDPKCLIITNRPVGGIWNKFTPRNVMLEDD